jgi:hypothetical protein
MAFLAFRVPAENLSHNAIRIGQPVPRAPPPASVYTSARYQTHAAENP